MKTKQDIPYLSLHPQVQFYEEKDEIAYSCKADYSNPFALLFLGILWEACGIILFIFISSVVLGEFNLYAVLIPPNIILTILWYNYVRKAPHKDIIINHYEMKCHSYFNFPFKINLHDYTISVSSIKQLYIQKLGNRYQLYFIDEKLKKRILVSKRHNIPYKILEQMESVIEDFLGIIDQKVPGEYEFKSYEKIATNKPFHVDHHKGGNYKTHSINNSLFELNAGNFFNYGTHSFLITRLAVFQKNKSTAVKQIHCRSMVNENLIVCVYNNAEDEVYIAKEINLYLAINAIYNIERPVEIEGQELFYKERMTVKKHYENNNISPVKDVQLFYFQSKDNDYLLRVEVFDSDVVQAFLLEKENISSFNNFMAI
ncbi:hypothetical protein [Flammeovirga sp. SJP92]|uniref:hypothetical protein n=1 Tax=Flammeovirga sp. SJP92 TaxID=1775430 RepID=UPI000787D912|nr:hypothetical protein [Flammeovirga sp. SJP92]KXX67941.1 hypothetical protein AVL50_24090 [Flammeovirga sp. SJP92]